MADQPLIRDALLLKCKQAIEDLHGEVDRCQVDNRELQMQNQVLSRDVERLQEKIKFMEHENQRPLDELKRQKSRAQQSEQKVNYLEEQIKAFQVNSDRYEEIRINFAELADQNIMLKQQLDEAFQDINDKNQLKDEWDKQIDQVSRRILNFQEDNKNLEEDKQQLEQRNHQLELINRELEQQMKSVNERSSSTIEKLKRQIDTLNNQSHRERENIRQEAIGEVEKLQRMADSLQSDIQRIREDKDRTQNEFYECRDALFQKESQLKELNTDYQQKCDQIQKNYYDEMKKLQHIIDDQSELIRSYERVVEREKEDLGRRQERAGLGETKQKDQITELTNKNSFLQTKLLECQQELQRIQGEVNLMFQQEESKNSAHIQTLQYQLEHSKMQVHEKDKEVDKLKASFKKKKNDYSFVESDKQMLIRDIQEREYKIEELERERQMRFNDFESMQMSLQRRIQELTDELDMERKKKINSNLNESRSDTNNNHRIEDKIRNIEEYYKQEIDYLKTELFRKERDFDQIQNKYDKSIQKVRHGVTQFQILSSRSTVQIDELRTQKLPDFSNKDLKQKTQQMNSGNTSKDIRYQSESEVDRSHIEPERDKKRRSNPGSVVGKQKNETEFLSKFQNVIARMENKLENMQSELNIVAKPIKKKY